MHICCGPKPSSKRLRCGHRNSQHQNTWLADPPCVKKYVSIQFGCLLLKSICHLPVLPVGDRAQFSMYFLLVTVHSSQFLRLGGANSAQFITRFPMVFRGVMTHRSCPQGLMSNSRCNIFIECHCHCHCDDNWEECWFWDRKDDKQDNSSNGFLVRAGHQISWH